jgi:hypothetical protein
MVFNSNISIIDRYIGKDIDTTIKTMDAIYYSDLVISKSSAFVDLFTTKKLIVPDNFCFVRESESAFVSQKRSCENNTATRK